MRYIPCLLSVEERGVLVCSLWVGYVFLFFCLGWTVSFDISFLILLLTLKGAGCECPKSVVVYRPAFVWRPFSSWKLLLENAWQMGENIGKGVSLDCPCLVKIIVV